MAGRTPHRDGRHKLGLAREQGRNRFPAPGRRRCHCCAPGTSDARLASTCCRCQQPRRRTANRPPADRPGRWQTNVMGDPPGANSNPNWRNSNLGSGWRPLLGAAGHRPGIAFPRMARHLRQAADCLPDAAPSRRPTASAWLPEPRNWASCPDGASRCAGMSSRCAASPFLLARLSPPRRPLVRNPIRPSVPGLAGGHLRRVAAGQTASEFIALMRSNRRLRVSVSAIR